MAHSQSTFSPKGPEGALNKFYLISYAGYHTGFLFRVSLPVEPYFKTESEVATLASLGAKASIPVTAWGSNPDKELGFEWLLMESQGCDTAERLAQDVTAEETCFDGRAGSHDQAVARFQVRPYRKLVVPIDSDEEMRET